MTKLGEQQRGWTEDEIRALKDSYNKMTCEEIAIELNRSTRSVQHKFNELGLKRNNYEIGDEINGWRIIDKFIVKSGNQNKTKVKLEGIKNFSITKITLMTTLDHVKPPEYKSKAGGQNKTHNMSNDKLYTRYHGMKNRCYNPNSISYKNYGARGIKVCDEWKNDFSAFAKWCQDNNLGKNQQIDRIDNDGDYSPENCRLVHRLKNMENRRVSVNITAWGETKNASDWSLDERCKTTYATMLYRINHNWTPEDAISTESSSRVDKFRRYKELYYFIKDKHPEIITEFLSQ